MDEKTRELRAKARLIKPLVQVGKNGVTPGTIQTIDHELSQRHLVKVRLLSAALPESFADDRSPKDEKRQIAQDIAAKTKSKVIDQIGNVIVFYRP